MYVPPVPLQEAERLQALDREGLFNTQPDPELDTLARLASQICGTDFAAITLVGEEHLLVKAKVGIEDVYEPRSQSLCACTIYENEFFQVQDLSEDQRFRDWPYSEKGVKFYAGYPLRTPEGHPLGSICVVDNQPRFLTQAQQESLRLLSQQATQHILLLRRERELALAHEQLQKHANHQQAELEAARTVQEHAFSLSDTIQEKLAIYPHYKPADLLCGDLLVMGEAGGHLTLLLADVSGHGASAAMVTMVLGTLFRQFLERTHPQPVDPAELLAFLNQGMGQSVPFTLHYATAIALTLYADQQKVSWCSAGHSGPLVLCPQQAIPPSVLAQAPPLNFWFSENSESLKSDTIPFPPGASLFVYTDGLADPGHSSGQERELRLREFLHHHTKAKTPGDSLIAALLQTFPPLKGQSDDQAFALIQHRPD